MARRQFFSSRNSGGGGAQSSVPGVYLLAPEKAYLFDGTNDYIDLGDVLNLHAGDFSVAFNIYSTVFNQNRIVMGKGTFNVDGWYLELNANQLYFTSGPGVTRTITAASSLTNSTAYHIVVTRSGADVKIYIDGEEVSYAAQADHTTIAASSVDFVVGIYPPDKASVPFSGKLSMVQIWNRELSAAEAKEVYESQNLSLNRQLLYKCDEGSGITAIDSSGNGNTGTLTNIAEGTFHTTW